MIAITVLAAHGTFSSQALHAKDHVDPALKAAIAGEWRTPDNVKRDIWRKPADALSFWGLQPGMTVLELSPSGGWWTEILAPYARITNGRYLATAADLSNPELSQAARAVRDHPRDTTAPPVPDALREPRVVRRGPERHAGLFQRSKLVDGHLFVLELEFLHQPLGVPSIPAADGVAFHAIEHPRRREADRNST